MTNWPRPSLFDIEESAKMFKETVEEYLHRNINQIQNDVEKLKKKVADGVIQNGRWKGQPYAPSYLSDLRENLKYNELQLDQYNGLLKIWDSLVRECRAVNDDL